MKNFVATAALAAFLALPAAQAATTASPAELNIVTQYFKGRFPSIIDADSKIPVVIDLTRLVQLLDSNGRPTPKAPSTVERTLNQLGCMRTYDNGSGHQLLNYTPRCVANALSLAANLDERIED